jgi:hypothetical protein
MKCDDILPHVIALIGQPTNYINPVIYCQL